MKVVDVRQLVNGPLSPIGISSNCETFWVIFQPWALSFDTRASRKGVYLFYNPLNNFTKPTREDRS